MIKKRAAKLSDLYFYDTCNHPSESSSQAITGLLSCAVRMTLPYDTCLPTDTAWFVVVPQTSHHMIEALETQSPHISLPRQRHHVCDTGIQSPDDRRTPLSLDQAHQRALF